MAKVWSVDGDTVKRHGTVIADIAKVDGHGYGWRWTGHAEIERYGFTDLGELMKDVQYFHRYSPPRITFHFASGRKVSF